MRNHNLQQQVFIFSPLVFTIAVLEALFWLLMTAGVFVQVEKTALLLERNVENLNKANLEFGNKFFKQESNLIAIEEDILKQRFEEEQHIKNSVEIESECCDSPPTITPSPYSFPKAMMMDQGNDQGQERPNPYNNPPLGVGQFMRVSVQPPSYLLVVFVLGAFVSFLHGNSMKPSGSKFLGTILLSFCLFNTALGSESHFRLADVSQCSGLDCWIGNLTIHIPDEKITVKEVIEITISLSNGICKGIQVGGLNSSLAPPTGISFAVRGVSITCNLDFEYQALLLQGKGSAEASVADSSVSMGLQLIRGNDTLADAAKLSACDVNVKVQDIKFSNSGILGVVLNILKGVIKSLIESNLSKIVCGELTGLVDKNLTNALQVVDNRIRPYLHPNPPSPPPPIPAGSSNLTASPLLAVVGYVLNDLIGTNGVLSINKIFQRLTQGTGVISMSNLALSIPIPAFTDVGTLTVGLLGFNISGLDTFDHFSLLKPIDNFTLGSYTSLQSLNISVEFFVNVTLGKGVLQGNSLYEKGIFVADLSQNTLNSSLVLAVNGTRLSGYALNQLICVDCWMSSIHELNITSLNLNFSFQDLLIKAEGGNAEVELDDLIDNVLALFVQSFKPAIPAFFNGFVSGPLRGVLNTEFDDLKQSKTNCVDSEEIPDNTFNKKSTIWVLIAAAATFVVIGIILFMIAEMRKKKSELASPLLGNHPIDSTHEILVYHPRIHILIRILVPLVLLFNIALFISSNTSTGASVYAIINVGPEPVELPAVSEFTLASSIHDMWAAGVYPLSLLIAVFSGAWPYVKLLLMLLCWVAPIQLLNIKRREQALMLLDVLGKWSLVDAFVMILMLVAFHFVIAPPVPPSSLASTSNVFVYVNPDWGFNCFLLATLMSLLATHFILACHRHAVHKPGEIEHLEQSPTRECLFSHAFKFHPSLLPFRPALIVLVVVLLLLSIGLLVAGSVLVSFEFEFRGAIALVLNFLEGTSTRHYSLLSLANDIPPSHVHPNSFAIRAIQATLLVFSFAVPLLYLVSLLVLWLLPMTYKFQRRLFVMTEIFQAWSTLEVFVVSVIAALLEIRQFAEFIVGDKCDLVNKLLSKYMSQELGKDAKCFEVIASLDSGCWFLFTACAVYVVVGTVVVRTCHKALSEREAANTPENSIPSLNGSSQGSSQNDSNNGIVN